MSNQDLATNAGARRKNLLSSGFFVLLGGKTMKKKMIMISSKGNESTDTLRLSTEFLDILVEIIADLEEGVDGNAIGGCGEQAA